MKSLSAIFCSIVFLVCSAAAAEAAQYVVVEARGVGWRPGTVVDADKAIHLLRGQHVMLISDSGATLKLDGPYDKKLTSEEAHGIDVGATLAALSTERQARLGDVGTTRAAPTANLPDPWVLDASRGGNECLREGETAVFWRPSAAKAAKFLIMPSDRSWKARSDWRAGSDRLILRSDIAVHGGDTYLVSLDGTLSTISLNTVPARLANDRMRAAWMADLGCEAQAESLLRASR
jgi:hypothetical protein